MDWSVVGVRYREGGDGDFVDEPAANWYAKGRGFSVDILAAEETCDRTGQRAQGVIFGNWDLPRSARRGGRAGLVRWWEFARKRKSNDDS